MRRVAELVGLYLASVAGLLAVFTLAASFVSLEWQNPLSEHWDLPRGFALWLGLIPPMSSEIDRRVK